MLATSDNFGRSSVCYVPRSSNYADSPYSDDLYDEVDNNTASRTANTSTIPEGNPAALSYTSAVNASSSSVPSTVIDSASISITPATTTSSTPIITLTSEKDNIGTQEADLRANDIAAGIPSVAQTLALTSHGSTFPSASLNNTTAGQRQKRVKVLAVIRTGLTDKCIGSWSA